MYLVRGIPSPKTPWAVPEDSTTYREWRKVYHFEVYWPRDSTRSTNMGTVSQLVSYASFYTWHYRDWVTRGGSVIHIRALRGQCSLRAHRTSCTLD